VFSRNILIASLRKRSYIILRNEFDFQQEAITVRAWLRADLVIVKQSCFNSVPGRRELQHCKIFTKFVLNLIADQGTFEINVSVRKTLFYFLGEHNEVNVGSMLIACCFR
jgi:hypothetical protein